MRATLILRLSSFWDLEFFFFLVSNFFFFNIVLTWKFVGASKASVLYIYRLAYLASHARKLG